jgi:phosphoribosylaminoimidazole carboxylase PurE protein
VAEAPTLVSVIVGSASDAEQIQGCREVLDRLGIGHEARVLSAHRTPAELLQYVAGLEERGVEVVIAAAGMAAHLAGVVAAHTTLPVLGVPLAAGTLAGMDALLATVQMPPGVPVATFGIGSAGGRNAAFFTARILAPRHAPVRERLEIALEEDRRRVLESELPPL